MIIEITKVWTLVRNVYGRSGVSGVLDPRGNHPVWGVPTTGKRRTGDDGRIPPCNGSRDQNQTKHE